MIQKQLKATEKNSQLYVTGPKKRALMEAKLKIIFLVFLSPERHIKQLE